MLISRWLIELKDAVSTSARDIKAHLEPIDGVDCETVER